MFGVLIVKSYTILCAMSKRKLKTYRFVKKKFNTYCGTITFFSEKNLCTWKFFFPTCLTETYRTGKLDKWKKYCVPQRFHLKRFDCINIARLFHLRVRTHDRIYQECMLHRVLTPILYEFDLE